MTVQIDGIGRQLPGLSPAPDEPEAAEGPVFVDESGSRSRRVRRIGWVLGICCAVYAVVLGVTLLSGNSDAPWMPGLGKDDDRPAGRVDTSPGPSELPGAGAQPVGPSTTPVPSGSASPGADPSGSASPGDSASPGATEPGEPSGNPSDGGPGPTDPGDPDPTDPPVTQEPTDPPPTTDPPVDPSETPVSDGAGAGQPISFQSPQNPQSPAPEGAQR
ncbi:hypothetical protein [Streptomyces sp. NBC_01304]|uniref:hypothetical protein n=1 Tax=Streptomyces sp. NBC_01304 TaxID=2903818 RepID=UPI002E0F3626|nr:hypothetical protein OG430_29805 [Streptomyces sp. NBC_01304]